MYQKLMTKELEDKLPKLYSFRRGRGRLGKKRHEGQARNEGARITLSHD